MTRPAILDAPDGWAIVPEGWKHPNGAIWSSENYPAGKDFTTGGWVPLYARPNPTALSDLVAYAMGLESELHQHRLFKGVSDGFADRQQKAILAAEARVKELEAENTRLTRERDEARAKAIEEAAKVADDYLGMGWRGSELPAAIRKLGETGE